MLMTLCSSTRLEGLCPFKWHKFSIFFSSSTFAAKFFVFLARVAHMLCEQKHHLDRLYRDWRSGMQYLIKLDTCNEVEWITSTVLGTFSCALLHYTRLICYIWGAVRYISTYLLLLYINTYKYNSGIYSCLCCVALTVCSQSYQHIRDKVKLCHEKVTLTSKTPEVGFKIYWKNT